MKKLCFTSFFLILIVGFYNQKVFRKETNIITWDVYGYYELLPATFIYKDVKHFHFAEKHLQQYHFSSSLYQLQILPNGNRIPIYTIGMAIINAPFFIATDFFVKTFSDFPRDGLSFPYQLGMFISSLFYGLIGLFFLLKFLSKYFSDKVVFISIIGIYFGTNYFHYIVFEPGMPHSYLFSLYAVLIYCVDEWYRNPKSKFAFFIGLIGSLLCLVRPSEIVFIALLIFYDWEKTFSFKEQIAFWWKQKRFLLLMIFSALMFMLLQIAYWHYVSGHFYYNAYKAAGHYFEWKHPHIIEGLFSYRKGWLIYTPIMVLSIVGLMLMFLKKEKRRFAFFLFFLLNIYFVFSWYIWAYASSFGMRALVQSYSILAFPFCFAVQQIFQHKKYLQWIFGIVFLSLIILNLFQDWQYNKNILPFDHNTKTYYWQVFGKTKAKLEWNKYLDIDEKITSINSFQKMEVAEFEVGNDSTSPTQKFQNEPGFLLPSKIEFPLKPHADWIVTDLIRNKQEVWFQVKTRFVALSDNFGEWNNLKLVLHQHPHNGAAKWNGVQIQNCTLPKQ